MPRSVHDDRRVETMGLEPTTPCLQSRCSSQLSYVPVTGVSVGATRTGPPRQGGPVRTVQAAGGVRLERPRAPAPRTWAWCPCW